MNAVDAVIISNHISDGGPHCLSQVSDKPMVQWTIEALRATEGIHSVTLVVPESVQNTAVASLCDALLTSQGDDMMDITSAVQANPESHRMLILAANMPLVSAASIEDFTRNCTEGDVVYAAVTRRSIASKFPDHDGWNFLRTTEGELTGAKSILFSPDAFRENGDALRRVFDARKDSSALMQLCGVGLAFKYALGQLSLADIEARIRDVLGIDGRSYITQYAELAFQVEDAEDLALCEEVLSGRMQ